MRTLDTKKKTKTTAVSNGLPAAVPGARRRRPTMTFSIPVPRRGDTALATATMESVVAKHLAAGTIRNEPAGARFRWDTAAGTRLVITLILDDAQGLQGAAVRAANANAERSCDGTNK